MMTGERLDHVQFADLALAYVEVFAELKAAAASLRCPLAAFGLERLHGLLVAADAQLVKLARRIVPSSTSLSDAEVLRQAGEVAFEVSNSLIATGSR